MPETPDVKFSTTDNTVSVTSAKGGTNWVVVQTKYGPYYDVQRVITSWPEFKRVYGGLDESNPDTLQCKIALEGGSKLRVCKVGHKVTGALSATKGTQVGSFENSAHVLLGSFLPKNPGAAYNDNLIISIAGATNGDAGSFNIIVGFYPEGEEPVVEKYENLTIELSNLTTYLTDIASKSKLVIPSYPVLPLDVDDIATFIPLPETITFTGGTNGGEVVDADYVEALHAFDEVEGLSLLAIPSRSSDVINAGIKVYVEARADIHGVVWLGDSDDEEDIISARETLGADTRYVYMIGGKERDYTPYQNPTTPMVDYSPVAGVLAAQAKVSSEKGPWISFAGTTKGKRNVFGVVNNFGTPAKAGALTKLNNRQINMVVSQDGTTYILGGFTSQKKMSQLSFIGISQLDLFIKQSLRPLYKGYLEEPLDFILVRQMFDVVDPWLDDLKKNKRALFWYEYQGDQNVNKPEDLVVNDPEQFGLGNYKVKIPIKAIAALQAVNIEIILTKAGATVSTN